MKDMIDLSGKIVVLYGGPSYESEVSKKTANAVFIALKSMHENVEMLEFTPQWQQRLKNLAPAFVFNAMHGCPGEDGTVQKALDEMNLHYQGCGAVASALAMDKEQTKQRCAVEGIDVVKGEVLLAGKLPNNLAFFPAFVKPLFGGSSVGAYVVKDEEQWQQVKNEVAQLNEDFLCEELLQGKELTVAVMEDKALGVMEMRPKSGGVYDYEAKYNSPDTEYLYPAPIATEVYAKAEEIAKKAHQTLGCKGVTRVDFMLDEKQGRLVMLELNTLPGMTDTSLVPKMAKANGYSYNTLVAWMVNNALED